MIKRGVGTLTLIISSLVLITSFLVVPTQSLAASSQQQTHLSWWQRIYSALKPNPSYAATSGTITGYVYWLDGSPVGNHATVYIDYNRNHIAMVSPDSNSLYSASLQPAAYQVYAVYDTYTSASYSVPVGSQTVNQNITFKINSPAGQQMAINAGNNQTATVGTAVSTPPSVKITNSNNAPISGVNVTFAIASGNGSLTNATQTTNSTGIATVGSWTLGTTAGTNTLTATATGASGSPLTFTATGTSSTGGGGTAQTPSPTFSPTSTTFTDSVDVSLTDADSSATIYYTTDVNNTNPTWTVYSKSIHLTATTSLKTKATSPGKTDSGVANVTYTKSGGTAQTPTPTFSPTSTSFTDAVDVSLTDTDTNATIYYTTDGTNVTSSSNKYSTAIHLTTTTSLKAFATSSGKTDSTTTSITYTKKISNPGYTWLMLRIVSKLDNNLKIYGADVKITNATNNIVVNTKKTNSNGEVFIKAPNSQLTISVTATSWTALTTTLDLSSSTNMSYQQTVQLSPDSSNSVGQLAIALDGPDPTIKANMPDKYPILAIHFLDNNGKEAAWCNGLNEPTLIYEDCATLKAGSYSLKTDPSSPFIIDSPQKITIAAGKRSETIVKISFPTQTDKVYFYLTTKDELGTHIDDTKYRFFDTKGNEIRLDNSINNSHIKNLGIYAFHTNQIKIGDTVTIQATAGGRSIKKSVIATQNNDVLFILAMEKCTKNFRGMHLSLPFSLCSIGYTTDLIVFNPSDKDVTVITNLINQVKKLQTKYKTTDIPKKIIFDPSPRVDATARQYPDIIIFLGMYRSFLQESLTIPSYLDGVGAHEWGHLYDKLNNVLSEKPPWLNGDTPETNFFVYINDDTKSTYIRDCVYELPTMTCGQLSVEKVANEGGHPQHGSGELFASVFADINDYPAAFNAKVETISDATQKSLVKKMIQTMQGY